MVEQLTQSAPWLLPIFSSAFQLIFKPSGQGRRNGLLWKEVKTTYICSLHFVSKCFPARKRINFETGIAVIVSTSHNQETVAALPSAEDAAPEAQSNVLGVFELYSIDQTFNVKLRTILRPIMIYRKYMIYNSEVPGPILSQIVNVQLNSLFWINGWLDIFLG